MFAIFARRDAEHPYESGSHLLLITEAAGFWGSRSRAIQRHHLGVMVDVRFQGRV
jgi:hypothetical protein